MHISSTFLEVSKPYDSMQPPNPKPLHQRSLSCGSTIRPDPAVASRSRHSSPPILLSELTPVCELFIHKERLFGSNWKVKDANKITKFRVLFGMAQPIAATLTAKDRTKIMAVLHSKRVLSDCYTFSLATPPNPNANKEAIVDRRISFQTKRDVPSHQTVELLFPSVCQTRYPIHIKNKLYSWRPLLINPSWVLMAEEPNRDIPIAKFKRKTLDPKVGQLLIYTNISEDDLSVFITALGYIQYRHLKKPLY